MLEVTSFWVIPPATMSRYCVRFGEIANKRDEMDCPEGKAGRFSAGPLASIMSLIQEKYGAWRASLTVVYLEWVSLLHLKLSLLYSVNL